jgi:hypothetical protein
MSALLAATLGLALAVLVDVLAGRLGQPRLRVYAASLLAGLVPTLLVGHAMPLTALALYGAWWFIFLNFTQGLESSLRIRLLNEVLAHGGRIDRATLLARYNDSALLGLRLARMEEAGAVVLRDGRLFVASTGLRLIAGVFRTLKRLLLGRESEFPGDPL